MCGKEGSGFLLPGPVVTLIFGVAFAFDLAFALGFAVASVLSWRDALGWNIPPAAGGFPPAAMRVLATRGLTDNHVLGYRIRSSNLRKAD